MGEKIQKKDKAAILAAIEWDGFPEDFEKEWFQDPDIRRALVDVEPWNYEEFPKELQNNRDIALECVKVRGDVYEYLPEKLKKEEDILEAAIRNGLNLQVLVNWLFHPVSEIAEKMLKRTDLVATAIGTHGGNQMVYADNSAWADKELANLALSKGFCHVSRLPKNMAAEKETVKQVVRNIPEKDTDECWQIIDLPEQLRFDEEFLLELIAICPTALKVIKDTKKLPNRVNCFPEINTAFYRRAYQVNKACSRYMSKEMKALVKEEQ